jgi:hypothetical protein
VDPDLAREGVEEEEEEEAVALELLVAVLRPF